MTILAAPDRTEAAEYYYKYIDQVAEGDIRDVLQAQHSEALAFFNRIGEERAGFRYAPDKWTIRQVLGHINDTERLFCFRAMWFGRALPEPLPSFEQDLAVLHSGADERPWRSHVDEFAAIRASTVALFRHMPADAWLRRGVASGKSVTVRALAYITAGHFTHHIKILEERYLP
jgi:hypothetical protein